jgi:hypothetical protein
MQFRFMKAFFQFCQLIGELVLFKEKVSNYSFVHCYFRSILYFYNIINQSAAKPLNGLLLSKVLLVRLHIMTQTHYHCAWIITCLSSCSLVKGLEIVQVAYYTIALSTCRYKTGWTILVREP